LPAAWRHRISPPGSTRLRPTSSAAPRRRRSPLEGALSVADYERLAEDRLEPGPWAYLAGGSGEEWTLRENRAAFERWTFRPRVLCDVSEISTATTVLGNRVEMPVVVAPVAYQQLYDPDGECATARGAAAAGAGLAVSTFSTRSHEEIAAAAPGLLQWCQLYVFQDRGITREHLADAAAAGCSAVVLTVDTPRLARRERDLRIGFEIPSDLPLPYARAAIGVAPKNPADQFALLDASVSWRDLEWIASEGGLPVVLKGVATAEDAEIAVEHGAAAVVVSNHGGRQLDGAPATLEALPEVAEAVAGRIDVYLDGGIRRGTDVAKALALGARAVLAGRAPLFGLAVAGEEGVRHVLELLRDELALALCLLGCTSPDELTRAHVQRSSR
jgi:isopentenyl diphosphate isomerase/L-lactate dehydrogenase-like FMN-dependent dehydrogenase